MSCAKPAVYPAILAAVLMLTLPLASPPASAKRITLTSDGESGKTVSFSGMDWNNTTTVTVPSGAEIISTRIFVTGLPDGNDQEAYPESPGLAMGGGWLWKFEGAGFGALGRQSLFRLIPSSNTITLGPDAPQVLNVLLPAAASVTNASLILEGDGILSPGLDAGADGAAEWSFSGPFSGGLVVDGLEPAMNEFLRDRATSFPDSWGNLMTSVPFVFNAGGNGTLKVTGLRVFYDAALNITNLTGALNSAVHSAPSGNVTVALGFFSQSPGRLGVSGIDIEYDHPPTAALSTPVDGAAINATAAQCFWSGADPDNDPLTYYFSLQGPGGSVSTVHLSDTTYLASGLTPGDYSWWAVPNDGIMNGTCISGQFHFRVISAGASPVVSLLSPADGAILRPGPVGLHWTPFIPLSGEVSYSIYLDETGATSLYFVMYGSLNTSFTADLLQVNRTYHWTVVPRVSTGNQTTIGSCASGVWDFTLGNTSAAGALPPEIRSQPVTAARVGYSYIYQVSAFDPGGSPLHYALAQFPPGMQMDFLTGIISWTPGPDQLGNFSVKLSVSDGTLDADQSFLLSVSAGSPPPPAVRIAYPADGSSAARSLYLMGVASAAPGAPRVRSVQVRVDSGPWQDANLTGDGWTFLLNSSKSRNGVHHLSVRAFDGLSYSQAALLNLTYDNPRSVLLDYPLSADGSPMPFIVLAFAIAIAGPLTIFAYIKGRERRALP